MAITTRIPYRTGYGHQRCAVKAKCVQELAIRTRRGMSSLDTSQYNGYRTGGNTTPLTLRRLSLLRTPPRLSPRRLTAQRRVGRYYAATAPSLIAVIFHATATRRARHHHTTTPTAPRHGTTTVPQRRHNVRQQRRSHGLNNKWVNNNNRTPQPHK